MKSFDCLPNEYVNVSLSNQNIPTSLVHDTSCQLADQILDVLHAEKFEVNLKKTQPLRIISCMISFS